MPEFYTANYTHCYRYLITWILKLIPIFLITTSGYSVGSEAPADYHVSPPGKWVKHIPFSDPESIPEKEISDGVYYLLIDRQVQIQKQSTNNFRHVAVKILNEDGLSFMSQIMVDFDPTYQNLQLHSISVHRQGEIFNKLNRKNITILQRETELDYQIYNGSRTANLILDDIRVGDIVEYSYAVSGSNPVFNGRYYSGFDTGWSKPVYQFSLRIVCPEDKKLFIKKHNTDINTSVSRKDNVNEYLFQSASVPALIPEDNLPQWYEPYPWIQVSESETWNDVALWGAELFAHPKDLSKEFAQQKDRIKKSSDDPKERVVASLKFVQDEIRYLGIEIGPGSHKPSDPSVTMKRRFGDCKDKTYVFCSMLREMGITAKPALVNTYIKDKLETYHPSPFAFNHVVAQVNVNGDTYWLDPTRTHQGGGLDNLYQPDYGKALVLDHNTRTLSDMNPPEMKEPTKTVTEEFDLTNGIGNPCYLSVTTRLTGRRADSYRAWYSSENKHKIEKFFLGFYASEYPSVKAVKSLTVEDDLITNTLVIREHYEITDFWEHSESKGRYEGNYYAGEVNDLIKTPDTPLRTMPFGLRYPIHNVHNVIMQLPFDLKISDKDYKIHDASFIFLYKKRYDQRNINLRYEYRSLKDAIEISEVKTYLDNIKKVKGQLGYSFYKKTNKEKPPIKKDPLSTLHKVVVPVIIFGAVFTVIIFLNYRRLKRSNYVISLLHEGNINQFIKEINTDITNAETIPKVKDMLTVNKTGGLFYKGEWGHALSLLNSINPDSLPVKFKIIYYNNKLSLLMISEQWERAKQLYTEHSMVLKTGLGMNKLKMAVKSTLATYEMHFGDLDKSREMFLSLLTSKHPVFFNSLVNYYLGVIEAKNNNNNESLEYFSKAKELGGCSFIPGKIDEILEKKDDVIVEKK